MDEIMKKHMLIPVIAGTISLMFTMAAFAGEWKRDNIGWWYQQDTGTYLSSGWSQIDGVWYYFDSNGYMLADTTTPDGYYVDASGAWTGGSKRSGSAAADVNVNSIIQTQNTKEKFTSHEKELWEHIFTANYYADISTYGAEYNIGTFIMVLLSESSLGAPYTADGNYYQIPKPTLQKILKNISGESLYTSDQYSWEPWGMIDQGDGSVGFYRGDFGSSYPYAKINTVDEIDTNWLKITGTVGERETGSNQIVYSKEFTARLEYIPNGQYSSFTERMFVTY